MSVMAEPKVTNMVKFYAMLLLLEKKTARIRTDEANRLAP